MKMLILGSNGMLGQMVLSYFAQRGLIVETYDKLFDQSKQVEYITDVNSFEANVVVNCVGLIKQRSESKSNLYDVNTRLPLALVNGLHPDTILIHPSTDCIFSGSRENLYPVSHVHDADDDYGISKSLGELALLQRPKSLVIRGSIVGPDRRSNGRGLMAWLLSKKSGTHVNGYTNHLWNGITTLEWCKVLNSLLETHDLSRENQIIVPCLKQPLSKYELLSLMNAIFDRQLEIIPYLHDQKINRALEPNYNVPSIDKQLEECFLFVTMD